MPPSFQEAAPILKQLTAHGNEAYIVGGAVRNFLLGKPVEDIDITTSAGPEDVRALFKKTIPVGIEHGTVIVRHNHRSYEVTTFRTESDYDDHRRPSSVSFVSSLEEDLKRRDFTMNAIAMSETGEIVDPFSGREAIRTGKIQTVGRAEERFREDPLRMMRAVRFVSQLSFEMDGETREAVRRLAGELRHISVERITVEFDKLLLGTDTRKAFTELADSGLYVYLPGLGDRGSLLNPLTERALDPLSLLQERWAVVAELLQIEDPERWLRQWKLSNQRIKEVSRILKALKAVGEGAWTPFLVYEYGQATALSAERVRAFLRGCSVRLETVRSLHERLPIQSRSELALNGDDLLEWFQKKPGPWVADWLVKAEKAVIAGETANDREAIRTWIEKQTY
ncbi:MAG TPA: CCA tRNA nucleotidyltransferase [Bacillales bacterium]|nr:CCA tRNA nucleotidyltransferase [Bacillales bacterium]